MGRPPVAREKDKTVSREAAKDAKREIDRLPDNLLASSLRVFAPSRGKRGVHGLAHKVGIGAPPSRRLGEGNPLPPGEGRVRGRVRGRT